MTIPAPRRKMIKVGALTYANLIKHMQSGVFSCYELAELTGLHYVTVLEYARELYRVGAAHIVDWGCDKRGRATLKIYKLGAGKDAKRPPRVSSVSRSAAYRRRQRQIKILNSLRGAPSGLAVPDVQG